MSRSLRARGQANKKPPSISAGRFFARFHDEGFFFCLSQAWQRPTLPRLKTKYHWRWSDLRPSSRWDRVWTLRHSHQAGEKQKAHNIFDLSLYQRSLPLWASTNEKIKPVERLVPISFTHYCASTLGLSTRSSSSVLKGEIVLRWVSRLDAFSGYPVHT